MIENRLIMVVMGGFMLGGAPWYWVEDFAGVEIDERVRSLMFGVFFLLFGLLSARLGRRYPKISTWANAGNLGLFCLSMLFAAFTVGCATLIALLPVPTWLHISIAAVLGLVGSYLLFQEITHSSH